VFLVVAGDEGQRGGRSEVAHRLDEGVLAAVVGALEVGVAGFLGDVGEQLGVRAELFVRGDAAGTRVPAAHGEIGRDARHVAGIARTQAHGAAEGGVADGRSAARTTVDLGLAQHVAVEIGRGGVVQVAGVAERNAVEGDVELPVLEAADADAFVLAQARTFRRGDGDAGGVLDDVVEVGIKAQAVADEALVDHRGRLHRVQRRGARRQRVHRVGVHADRRQFARGVIGVHRRQAARRRRVRGRGVSRARRRHDGHRRGRDEAVVQAGAGQQLAQLRARFAGGGAAAFHAFGHLGRIHQLQAAAAGQQVQRLRQRHRCDGRCGCDMILRMQGQGQRAAEQQRDVEGERLAHGTDLGREGRSKAAMHTRIAAA